MFGSIDKILKNAVNLNADKAWMFAIDVEVKEEIIRLNTEDQLFSEGIDSKGDMLGQYAPFTVSEKKVKGQRFDHITLRDTGAFYNSFRVIADPKGITIKADDTSLYDVPLTQTWGIDVLGLTLENWGFIREMILDNLKIYARKELFL